VKEIKAVIDDFYFRFFDSKKLEEVIPFISFPFKEDLFTQIIAKKAQHSFQFDELFLDEEMINLQCNIFLKVKSSEYNFWHLVSTEKYPNYG